MKKSFEDQLLPILKARFRDNDDEVKRHLKEASTPAAQTLIQYIRQWEFGSRNIALERLIDCNRWNDKGELVLERDFKGKPYPPKVPLAMAWDWYVYGDQREQVIPGYSFAGNVKKIPDNITNDWQVEVKGLFIDINRMPLNTFKIVALGSCVRQFGAQNPYTFTYWDRQSSEFKAAQEAINAFVVTRKDEGWKHLTTTNLQDPKSGKEMSKIISDILARADELVEPSIKAISEANKKMYARQDATRARNDIKTLKGFFKKYGSEPTDALEIVRERIDGIEKSYI